MSESDQKSNVSSMKCASPNIFSDTSSEDAFMDADEEMNSETHTPIEDTSWKGLSMKEIYNEKGPWGWDSVPIVPSNTHLVLFRLPLPNSGPPVPTETISGRCWNKDYVRMPFSIHSLYPVEKSNGHTELIQRWELVKNALSKSISNSKELERAILSYNSKYASRWKFEGLRHLLNLVLEDEEREYFFNNILPKIKSLALILPELLPSSIPLLKKNESRAITLSQKQIASLLANAFFCTYPRRNATREQAEFASYPQINFIRLFQACPQIDLNDRISEKLKCILNYFRRVSAEDPDGVVTFERQYLSRSEIPLWDRLELDFSTMRVHISDTGTIDGNGQGLLQVDFANRYVGGGILGHGCVQEEIRFAICPELIAACLFTEELGPTEALIVTGVEQYSKTKGYANTFKWIGDFKDATPRDSFKRKKCQVVAIDALHFLRPVEQFRPFNMIRELNKAYSGFYSSHKNVYLEPVATGNWGCGAFRGDPYLKILLQLMACRAAGRNMVYYSFQNTNLRDRFYNMYTFLVENNVTIARLWRSLCEFSRENLPAHKLYAFLYRQLKENKHSKNNLKETMSVFFKNNLSSKKISRPCNDSPKKKSDIEKTLNELSEVSDISESMNDEECMAVAQLVENEDVVNENATGSCLLSKLDEQEKQLKVKIDTGKLKNALPLDIFEELNSKRNIVTVKEEADKPSEEKINIKFEENSQQESAPKRKISDYFSTVN